MRFTSKVGLSDGELYRMFTVSLNFIALSLGVRYSSPHLLGLWIPRGSRPHREMHVHLSLRFLLAPSLFDNLVPLQLNFMACNNFMFPSCFVNKNLKPWVRFLSFQLVTCPVHVLRVKGATPPVSSREKPSGFPLIIESILPQRSHGKESWAVSPEPVLLRPVFSMQL